MRSIHIYIYIYVYILIHICILFVLNIYICLAAFSDVSDNSSEEECCNYESDTGGVGKGGKEEKDVSNPADVHDVHICGVCESGEDALQMLLCDR